MVENNIVKIKQRILSACSISKQDSSSVEIVAVSKGRRIPQIKEVIEAGITNIGENKVQEVLAKLQGVESVLCGRRIKWHMVGHLQRNKVKDAVKIFDLIQSVDSLRLAEQIDKEAAKTGSFQEILIEVKTSPETTKFGFLPEEIPDAVKAIAKLRHIKLKGLMTIAPVVDHPEETRPSFRALREIRDGINDMRLACDMQYLSMGMSDDFEVAIEEGSNMIRLGRAIFGEEDV